VQSCTTRTALGKEEIIMYDKEMMIQMMEDLQHQASEMEKNVKDMLEQEGRACGIELDKRKNARDLMEQLIEHQDSQDDAPAMTWAYVPEDQVNYDTHAGDWTTDMHTQALYETGADMPNHDDMDYSIPHEEDHHGGLPSDVEPMMDEEHEENKE